MTKEKLNGRFIITKTAADFVDEFTSLEEVDFQDMKVSAKKVAKGFEELGKKNITIEFLPGQMKIVTSYDL